MVSSAAVDSIDDEIDNQDKPWFVRTMKIQVGPFAVSVSLMTVLTVLLVLLQVTQQYWTRPSWAEASHILLRDHTPATKQLLINLKKDIDNNPDTFSKLAKEWSACPSKSNGGFLGRFKPGDMARNFNQAVFDPQTPLQQTIGPIETSFGWHLIYIHQRHLNQQVLAHDD